MMKNKELFDKSVAVLTKAYINDTLQHGSTCGCAVGNLVCAGLGITPEKGKDSMLSWGNVFCSNPMPTMGMLEAKSRGIANEDRPLAMKQQVDFGYYHGQAAKEIDSTGYSVFQLAAIEKAFESKAICPTTLEQLVAYTEPNPEQKDQAMFDGLCAVYDTLCEIHGVEADDNVPAAKAVFVK